mmetsp:Transcript_19464/g.32510  ORF Transcript_19464/g.32510 Transcript_19464/m.32510 type:complete len:755 (-) Transcript_19464:63-2327(-)
MDHFEVVRLIGQGAFGEVTECKDKATGERFAVKVISNKRYETWQECLKLREVRALRQLGSHHKNIVVLRQIIRDQKKLYLVFEYHPTNLCRRIQAGGGNGSNDRSFSLKKVKTWAYQLLDAMAYMHRYGFFHRDIKPENLLLDSNDCIQVCDFGLARDVRSRPPFTDYVSTKWYRAPELVLRSNVYNSPVDIWACGCVVAEMLTLRPLFPAKDRMQHLLYLTSYLGPINSKTWPTGYALSMKQRVSLPTSACSTPLAAFLRAERMGLTSADNVQDMDNIIHLLSEMLQLDPKARLSALNCLHHVALKTEHTIRQSQPATGTAGAKECQIVAKEIHVGKNEPSSTGRPELNLSTLTLEIDELAREVQDIKTSPTGSSGLGSLNRSDSITDDFSLSPGDAGLRAETSRTSPKTKKRFPFERKSSMERRAVISQYLSTLDDDEDEDEDEIELLTSQPEVPKNPEVIEVAESTDRPKSQPSVLPDTTEEVTSIIHSARDDSQPSSTIEPNTIPDLETDQAAIDTPHSRASNGGNKRWTIDEGSAEPQIGDGKDELVDQVLSEERNFKKASLESVVDLSERNKRLEQADFEEFDVEDIQFSPSLVESQQAHKENPTKQFGQVPPAVPYVSRKLHHGHIRPTGGVRVVASPAFADNQNDTPSSHDTTNIIEESIEICSVGSEDSIDHERFLDSSSENKTHTPLPSKPRSSKLEYCSFCEGKPSEMLENLKQKVISQEETIRTLRLEVSRLLTQSNSRPVF